MSKKVKYTQCTLSKSEISNLDNINMKRIVVSWIPSRFAIVGMKLKLMKHDESGWESGWIVEQAGQEQTEEPPDWRKLIRGHRRNTGDSDKKC